MSVDADDAPEGFQAVKAFSASSCALCAFHNDDGACKHMRCSSCDRKDGQEVYFIKRGINEC